LARMEEASRRFSKGDTEAGAGEGRAGGGHGDGGGGNGGNGGNGGGSGDGGVGTVGQRVGKQTIVMDMTGLSLWPNVNGFTMFKKCLSIDKDYYPETLANHFIINAPFVFKGIWRVIKGYDLTF
jgi:hypothetical protein